MKTKKATYIVIAQNFDGEVTRSYVEASDHIDAIAQYRDTGFIPIYALETPHVTIAVRSGVAEIEEITGDIEVGVSIQDYDVQHEEEGE